MKKLVLTAAVFGASLAYAQCNIVGKSTINVLDTETYTVESDIAQCKDCHLWVNVGGNSKIESDNKANSIKIKANSGGREVISLAMLTPNGFVQCSKNIDIIDSATLSASSGASTLKENSSCDIETKDFKEVKYADNIVSFFPTSTEKEYKYTWTASYFNGESKESREKVPQFFYTKENGLQKVSVKVVSSKCIRNYSKTYDSSFWKFF